MGDRFVIQIMDGETIKKSFVHDDWNFPDDEHIIAWLDEYPECTVMVVREYFKLPFA